MSVTWVICGAARHVGKTTLALRLCELLPNAVYAKQGCGPRKPDKPPNLFRTADELASFVTAARAAHAHVVVESNEFAHSGRGDLVIFVDGAPGRSDCRADSDLLREKAHVRIGPDAARDEWRGILGKKLSSGALCEAVCDVLVQHACGRGALSGPVRQVTPLRYSAGDARPVRDPGNVVVEELITIMIEDVGSFTLMCTPCDIKALAVGFAYSEGLIASADDVLDFSYRAAQRVVGLRLDDPDRGVSGRNLIVTSSCGLCGSRSINKLLSGRVASPDSLRVSPSFLRAVAQDMRARQALFTQTGGTHAAGIFAADGTMMAFGEDIGRHNALDKAIGRCLLEESSLASRGVVLSGRVSLELVAKSANAGIELVAGVSAPSSLAIDVAARCNITLCGFVRQQRATVYTHPHRIVAHQRWARP